MEKNSKKLLPLIILAVSIIVVVCHAFFFYQKKSGYYLDEALSFQLANDNVVTFETLKGAIQGNGAGSEQQVNTFAAGNYWESQDEIMAHFTIRDGERFNYLSPYLLQASDVHPPLYYFLIRTICSIAPNMKLFAVGFVINIVFLVLAMIFLYKLSMLVFDNAIPSIAVVLYYGLSYDFINNVTYYRMYAMLTFWIICAIYVNLQWYLSNFADDKKMIRKICLVDYFSMITQYFALFFCLPLFVLNMVFLKKKNKPFGRYLKHTIITGVVYLITWPVAIYHVLFTNRGGDVTGNLGGLNFLRGIWGYRFIVSDGLFGGSKKIFFAMVLLTLITVCYKLVMKKKNQELKTWMGTKRFGILMYLFVTAGVYFFIASNAAPWFADRYVMPAIPCFCLIVVEILVAAFGTFIKNRKIVGALTLVFALAVCILWHGKLVPNYLYNSPERLEYKNICSDYDAVLIDKTNDYCNSEIELNFNHPRIFETDDSTMDSIDKEVPKDKPLIFYISKTPDVEDIEARLADMGFELEKLDLEANYYQIYKTK